MECPNVECKKNVEGMRKTLFGEDGLGGVVRCINQKISKKVVISIVVILVGAVVPLSLYGLEALKTDRENIVENKTQIVEIKTELKAIKVIVDKNQESLEEIKGIIIAPEDLKKIITDAVTEGNKNR